MRLKSEFEGDRIGRKERNWRREFGEKIETLRFLCNHAKVQNKINAFSNFILIVQPSLT